MRFYNKITTITILLLISCNSRKEVKYFKPAGKVDYIKYFNDRNDTLNYYVKYFRDNGTTLCEGQKSNNERVGKWKFYNENNIIESIQKFSKGLLTDTQTIYFSDGKLDRYKILDQPIPCFCDTQLHYGFTQIAYWRNGKLREVNHMQNCQFNGKTKLYDSITGRLEEEFYEMNDMKNGMYKKFYKDSSIMIGNYKNDKPVGKWKTVKGDSTISELNY